MGSLPAIFSGNRVEAEDFINGIQAYICLNREVPGFTSPMKKIALTLTLMQGEKVAGWAHDMREALDKLNPATNNIPALWDAFLAEFWKQYLDTQAANWARAELENLSVTGLEITCLPWPAASHVSLITGSKGASFVWSSSLIDQECGNWSWLNVNGLILIDTTHHSYAPLCCFKGWCHHWLIDLYVLPCMALPHLVVFILPCSLVGTASWVSCLNIIVVFSSLFLSARS